MKDALSKGGQIIKAVNRCVSDILTPHGKIVAIGQVRKAICDQTYNATSFLISPGSIDIHTDLKLHLSDAATFDTLELSDHAIVFDEINSIVEFALQQREKSALKKRFFFDPTLIFLEFYLNLLAIQNTIVFLNLINTKKLSFFKINITCPTIVRLNLVVIIKAILVIFEYLNYQTNADNILFLKPAILCIKNKLY
jgi:hypothetical protein